MRTPIYFIALEQFMKNKVSTFVSIDLSPKDDQDRGEDTKIAKNIWGESPFAKTTSHNTIHFRV